MDAELRQLVVANGSVSALWLEPPDASAVYVLAHGAGAGMRHAFMEDMAQRLAARGVATLRYQFPYMERKSGRTDPPSVATATVRAAVEEARALRPDLMLVAGGKSFGGRMTSTAQAERGLDGVAGLVFLGFPLHQPKSPATTRGEHLDDVRIPMLFLQGTRDDLADIQLIREVTGRLGTRATLHEIPEGNHSFAVPKRTGRTSDDVMDDLVGTITQWTHRLVKT